jgi:glycerol-3-phosphate acyltransferase PlsY
MLTLTAAIAGYLLGSISFAVVVTRLMRLPDPRSYGSKNPGATNVLRSGSKAAAVLTLLGDAAKGWLAVAIVPFLAAILLPKDCISAFSAACVMDEVTAAAVAALAAFLGHLFPVFHRFQGGKGVATAAGALFGLDAWLGLGTLATFGVIAAFFRYVSLASMIAAAFAIFFAWFLKLDVMTIGAVAAITVFLVWRHKDNIKRLIAGTESKLGAKQATPPDPSAASQ